MNRIEQLAADVGMLMADLDQDIARFRQWSGLGCVWGCGRCCLKPDIEASPLEFLPFALHVWNSGQMTAWVERIRNAGTTCVIFDESLSGPGACSQYPYRGLICRLFGFAARRNKYGARELVTCSVIKEGQSDSFRKASEAILDPQVEVPVFTRYYDRLRNLDPDLGSTFLPINHAILRALEVVAQFMDYLQAEGTVEA